MGINDTQYKESDLIKQLTNILKFPIIVNEISILERVALIDLVEERKKSLGNTIGELISCNENYPYPEEYKPDKLFDYWEVRVGSIFTYSQLKYLENLIQKSITVKKTRSVDEALKIIKENRLKYNLPLDQEEKKLNPFRDKPIFKIALTFATGEAQKMHENMIKNDNKNFTQLALNLGFKKSDHNYFSATINNIEKSNTKNLYQNKKVVREIYSYYKEKGLELHKDFLDKVDLNALE